MKTINCLIFRARIRARTLAVCAVCLIALSLPVVQGDSVADANGKLANQPRSEYKARRQKLMQKVKDGIVVLIGAREDDLGEVGRFRQKSDFMYLTGVETPAASLMLIPAGLIPDTGASETVFIPQRNKLREQYTGFQVGPGPEGEQKFGIQEVAPSNALQERLRALLNAPPFKVEGGGRAAAKLYTIVPHGSTAPISRENQFIETVRKFAPDVQIADVSNLIAELRKIKSASELELIQKAIDITGEAQADCARTIRPGAYEYEVQGALEYAFTRNGAERFGFPSIVGSGIYSTILHYNENRRKIEAGDVIVVDIGAEYSYYTADITRTYPATGKFTPRQREIYQLVLDAQRAAEKAFKPGESTISDLQRAASGVMKASPLRDKEGKTLDVHFIHGLGHWLGMDVHDVGAYGGPVPVGALFTIEPGIYLADEKLGVRIEDDYLVTEKGLIKMSAKIPSDPDEIERLMARARDSRGK